ncbi:MAG: GGDEF domain-containing protein [Sedimenticolaceae bacterium]
MFLPETEVTPEQGQAITRIILAALGAILFFGARQYGHGDNPFLLSVAYLLASVFYLSFISRHKDDYQWRRYVVILLDLGVASFLTGYFGQAGIAFYPLFLWVMVGNGLRYGEHFMQVATLFGLLGFSTALASSGFLWQQPAAYIGLMSGLVLMPKFFLVMIDRLAEANTELKAQKDHAEYMATHDVLTGLPNRACLHARMDQTLARARRTGNDVAVAFIDLDSSGVLFQQAVAAGALSGAGRRPLRFGAQGRASKLIGMIRSSQDAILTGRQYGLFSRLRR